MPDQSSARYGGFAQAADAYAGAERTVVDRNLVPGERIYWVGRPNPDKLFTARDWFLVPFSVLWCGFAIFWEASASTGGAGVFFELWGIPFVLIGLYMVFGRFIWKAHRKKQTAYAVTDRRVLSIIAGRRGDTVEAAYLRTLPGISITMGRDGSGTVTFGSNSMIAGVYANTGLEFFGRGAANGSTLSFYDIADAREVADLVESLRAQERTSQESK